MPKNLNINMEVLNLRGLTLYIENHTVLTNLPSLEWVTPLEIILEKALSLIPRRDLNLYSSKRPCAYHAFTLITSMEEPKAIHDKLTSSSALHYSSRFIVDWQIHIYALCFSFSIENETRNKLKFETWEFISHSSRLQLWQWYLLTSLLLHVKS